MKESVNRHGQNTILAVESNFKKQKTQSHPGDAQGVWTQNNQYPVLCVTPNDAEDQGHGRVPYLQKCNPTLKVFCGCILKESKMDMFSFFCIWVLYEYSSVSVLVFLSVPFFAHVRACVCVCVKELFLPLFPLPTQFKLLQLFVKKINISFDYFVSGEYCYIPCSQFLNLVSAIFNTYL